MKVVLFCGGFGMRIRAADDPTPKPLVKIGPQPVLWHIMKYYAHYGHKDFLLCLGWKAEEVKQYFLDYSECLSNDFTMSNGPESARPFQTDLADWNITFVDSGPQASIAERLLSVRPFLQDDACFLANYADGLTDVPLPRLIDVHRERDAVATFLSVRPTHSFHAVRANAEGKVQAIKPVVEMDLWMNGGYFVLSNEVFDHIGPGEELVEEPFVRLANQGRLATLKYDGFWSCMDTYKEKQALDQMAATGDTPWSVWRHASKGYTAPSSGDVTVGNGASKAQGST